MMSTAMMSGGAEEAEVEAMEEEAARVAPGSSVIAWRLGWRRWGTERRFERGEDAGEPRGNCLTGRGDEDAGEVARVPARGGGAPRRCGGGGVDTGVVAV